MERDSPSLRDRRPHPRERPPRRHRAMGARAPRARGRVGISVRPRRTASIPLEARILAVADAFEAMVSERAAPPRAQPRGRDARSCAATPERSSTPGVVDVFVRALAKHRVRQAPSPLPRRLRGLPRLIELLVYLPGHLARQPRHRLQLLACGAQEALRRPEVAQQHALAGRARRPAARPGPRPSSSGRGAAGGARSRTGAPRRGCAGAAAAPRSRAGAGSARPAPGT